MRYILTSIATITLTSSVLAHHSEVGIDVNSVVTVQGTVIEFSWRNPHVYITLNTTDERGEPLEWRVQTSSTLTMTRVGWNRDSLSRGDRVSVQANPAQDGRAYGILRTIEKENGITLPTSFNRESGEPLLAEPEVAAATNSLAGRWRADTSKLANYPGGFDGFFHAP